VGVCVCERERGRERVRERERASEREREREREAELKRVTARERVGERERERVRERETQEIQDVSKSWNECVYVRVCTTFLELLCWHALKKCDNMQTCELSDLPFETSWFDLALSHTHSHCNTLQHTATH